MQVHRYTHIVWAKSLKAARTFLPSGKKWDIQDFQRTFRGLVNKIKLSERLLSDYGLMARVKLGRSPFSDCGQIAEYLYRNSIHPILFASALHLIANQAKSLEPRVRVIQLGNLRRDNIQTSLQRGVISDLDIGAFIYQEIGASTENKLAALEKLGVITYYPETVEQPVQKIKIRMMPLDDPKLKGLPLFGHRG